MNSTPTLFTPTDPLATKVIFKGTVLSWAEKAPFTPSGRAISIKGGIETNEDETLIRCHESGEWHQFLNFQHLRAHGLDRIGYKKLHGIERSSSLIAPALRRRKIASATKHLERLTKREKREWRHARLRIMAKALSARMAARRDTSTDPTLRVHFWEDANLKMNCRAQLGKRVPELAMELGHVPTIKELRVGDKHGPIDYRTIEWAFGMTYSEALREMGLVPPKRGLQRIAGPIELAILKLRTEGKSYAAIAAQLTIAPSTAFNYGHGAERS